MGKMLLLAKIILKSTFGSISTSLTTSRNKRFVWLIVIAMVVIFLPYLYLLTIYLEAMLEMLQPLEQTGIVINVVLAFVTIFVFLLSLIQVPSIYYYAKDTEIYLALPVKPYQILGAKFLSTLVFQYVVVLAAMVPLTIAFNNQGLSIHLLPLIISSLFLPVLPLLVSSIMITLLMNFIPLFKNKNMMNLVISFLVIIASLFVSFALTGSTNMSQEALMELLMQGNNSLAQMMFTFLPTINWAAQAINDYHVVSMLLVVVVNVALFILYCFLAQGLYLRGAQGIHESVRSRKVFDDSSLKKGLLRQGPMVSLVKRELYELVRTPAYLLNNVSIGLMLPLIFFGTILFTGDSSGGIELNEILEPLLNTNMLFAGVVGGFLIGIFSGGINSVAATSISRDAYHLDALKSYPITKNTLIYSKVFVGFLISLLTIVATTGLIIYLVNLPILFYVAFLFTSVITTMAFNMMAIIFDLFNPKLNWTTEQQAVKQNMNSMISVLVGMGAVFVIGFIFIRFALSTTMIILMIIGLLLLMAGSLVLVLKTQSDNLLHYD